VEKKKPKDRKAAKSLRAGFRRAQIMGTLVFFQYGKAKQKGEARPQMSGRELYNLASQILGFNESDYIELRGGASWTAISRSDSTTITISHGTTFKVVPMVSSLSFLSPTSYPPEYCQFSSSLVAKRSLTSCSDQQKVCFFFCEAFEFAINASVPHKKEERRLK
jgi:hypothetical protein